MTPYLYKTTDYGVTWTKITDGITPTEFTRAIREDLVRPGMLYAATERSMWLSYDAGKHWQNLARNLPPVPVHDIALRDDDMVIATHGRAFWVMENLTPLRQAPEVALASGKNFFYKPAPAYRVGGSQATVMYRLAQAGQVVTLEFLDARGQAHQEVRVDRYAADAARGSRRRWWRRPWGRWRPAGRHEHESA